MWCLTISRSALFYLCCPKFGRSDKRNKQTKKASIGSTLTETQRDHFALSDLVSNGTCVKNKIYYYKDNPRLASNTQWLVHTSYLVHSDYKVHCPARLNCPQQASLDMWRCKTEDGWGGSTLIYACSFSCWGRIFFYWFVYYDFISVKMINQAKIFSLDICSISSLLDQLNRLITFVCTIKTLWPWPWIFL